MSVRTLPLKPDLEQLRRQARELYRAASDGDGEAPPAAGRGLAGRLAPPGAVTSTGT